MSRPQITSKGKRNWEKIGAIAGICGAIAASIALLPLVVDAIAGTSDRQMYDGPIAEIAIKHRQYDKRGFNANDLESLATQIEYRYAGHYTDESGKDWNPDNRFCRVLLQANPSKSLPFGGESGFVFVQPGTSRKSKGIVLHNPGIDEIYRTRLEYEYVPPECWPSERGMRFLGQ